MATRLLPPSFAAVPSRTAWPKRCASIWSIHRGPRALRRPAGRGDAPRAPRVRQRRQREGGLPRGARPSPVRRAAPGPALCPPPDAEDARLHRHRPRDPGALPGRQSGHLRRRRLGPAPAAAVSRRRPAGERVQHLPEGRRARRRLLGDQLLRAPRRRSPPSPPSPPTATAPPSSASPARRNGSRSPGLSGVLRDPGARPGAWGARSRRRRPPTRRTAWSSSPTPTGGSAWAPTPASSDGGSGWTVREDRGRGAAARFPLPLLQSPALLPPVVEPGGSRARRAALGKLRR